MIKDHIEREGQRFVDEAVYAMPKRRATIEASVQQAFGREGAKPIVLGHERVRLRWMKPGPNGTVVPR